jgi:gamma-glutamyltranspeptidase
MRHLWFGENVKEAVDAARFHHQLYPMEFSYEYGIMQVSFLIFYLLRALVKS